ncbi:MAG: TlpA disulfide reductase family protein [Bacteroidota bacterium]
MKNAWMIFFLVISAISYVNAQKKANPEIYPEVGKSCPSFILHNIKYYHRSEAKNSDFMKKWLVLDFWNKNCGACVLSFPKVSALQNQFVDKVQFIMVGIQDKENQIQPMFERFRKRENLLMPCAFDSTLAKRWDIYTAPYIIIIDPEGIVKAITGSIHANDIESFLSNKVPPLGKVFRVHENINDTTISFDPLKPFMIGGNGAPDTPFIFRSLISKFSENQHFHIEDSICTSKPGMFQVTGQTLSTLLNYAWYGKPKPGIGYATYPILNVADSSLFVRSPNGIQKLFCYSLILSPNKPTSKLMQSIMQSDFQLYFGYKITLEERQFPCFKMVATQKARQRLKTKGGVSSFKVVIPKIESRLTNWPMNDFIERISYGLRREIIDSTGITENIDIHINCIITDLEDVKRELHSKGLNLEATTTLKKVLVIRDSSQFQ